MLPTLSQAVISTPRTLSLADVIHSSGHSFPSVQWSPSKRVPLNRAPLTGAATLAWALGHGCVRVHGRSEWHAISAVRLPPVKRLRNGLRVRVAHHCVCTCGALVRAIVRTYTVSVHGALDVDVFGFACTTGASDRKV